MEADEAKKSLQKQLTGGASSLVLLALLHQQGRPMYGYEIAKELERQNGGSLPMNSGALYPVLRSLEKQRLLSSYTELSDEDRARRYYELTDTGRETIGHWRTAWQDTKKFVDTILEDNGD
jgi:PadR family transcriptional regulator PadR